MKTIWKFPLQNDLFSNKIVLQMPLDAKILTVQMQGDTPCLWAEVYPGNLLEERRFVAVGTGQEIPPGVTYIDTFQEGPYVWHLYEGPRGGTVLE